MAAMPVILGSVRLSKEDHHMIDLGYLERSKPRLNTESLSQAYKTKQ